MGTVATKEAIGNDPERVRAFGLGLMGVAVDAPELQDTPPKDPRRGIH